MKGLRSFARDYKEQVASNGLRGLITTLSKDSQDEETVKFILETLLLLFDRKEGHVSNQSVIVFWETNSQSA